MQHEQYKPSVEKHDDIDIEILDNLHNLGISEADLVGKKVLDIGAGGGEFAQWANRHGANVTSLALDLEPQEIERLGATHTPFVIGNATHLPFPDASFELVLSHAAVPNVVSALSEAEDKSLESLAEAAHERRCAAVREAVRVLKPGGEIRFAPVIRNERNAWGIDRNISMKKIFNELRSEPGLELVEESLQKDEEGGGGIVRDTYRIIIRKK